MNGQEDHIRRLRKSNERLRAVIRSVLEPRNAFDDGFCRWCWKLGGEHNEGCWTLWAEKVLKETGGLDG